MTFISLQATECFSTPLLQVWFDYGYGAYSARRRPNAAPREGLEGVGVLKLSQIMARP